MRAGTPKGAERFENGHAHQQEIWEAAPPGCPSRSLAAPMISQQPGLTYEQEAQIDFRNKSPNRKATQHCVCLFVAVAVFCCVFVVIHETTR